MPQTLTEQVAGIWATELPSSHALPQAYLRQVVIHEGQHHALQSHSPQHKAAESAMPFVMDQARLEFTVLRTPTPTLLTV